MVAKTLGQRIALIREKRGLTQSDVAELTGLKIQNISRLETDAREHARSDTLIRLAQALDVSTDYLLGLTDEPILSNKRTRAFLDGRKEKGSHKKAENSEREPALLALAATT